MISDFKNRLEVTQRPTSHCKQWHVLTHSLTHSLTILPQESVTNKKTDSKKLANKFASQTKKLHQFWKFL